MGIHKTAEKLDGLLKKIYEEKYILYYEVSSKEVPIIKARKFNDEIYEYNLHKDLNDMLMILLTSEYIKEVVCEEPVLGTTNNNIDKSLSITVKGSLFYEQGGYTGEILKGARIERRLELQTKMTWILALGVFTPFFNDLLEIVNKFDDDDNPIGSYTISIAAAIIFLLLIFNSKSFKDS